jgi:hypothetical protein
MATRLVTTTAYTDDLTGGRAAGTVTFAIDGQSYEIDLSKANTKALEKALAPYLGVARKVRVSRTNGTRRTTEKHDLSAVRQWAKSNGFDVSARGRVATAVIAAYEAR